MPYIQQYSHLAKEIVFQAKDCQKGDGDSEVE